MQGDKRADNHNDLEFMDLDEKEQTAQEDEWEEDWPDEPDPLEPWKMVLIFAGLTVLAAIICAVLWFFTHRDNTSEPNSMSTEPPVVTGEGFIMTTEAPDLESVEPEDSLPDNSLSESAAPDESGSAETPEPTEDVAAVATPEPESQAVDPEDGDVSMSFEAIQQSVTPKDVVNLRSVPSTADADTVVAQAQNGEVLSQIGVNRNTGWSKIDYNGQTLYAVTQYLTTDLSYKTPVTPADPNRVSTISGRIIIFTDCDDQITPKEYVNLRTEPSTTEGDATVSCQVTSGESVHRTGVSPDSGWSRVEYNGQVLYVVTSLMQVVQ